MATHRVELLSRLDHEGLPFTGKRHALGCEGFAKIGRTGLDRLNLRRVEATKARGDGLHLAKSKLDRRRTLVLDRLGKRRTNGGIDIERRGEQPRGKHQSGRQHGPDGDIATMIARQRMQGGKLAAGQGKRAGTAGEVGNKTDQQDGQEKERSTHRHVSTAGRLMPPEMIEVRKSRRS